MANLQIVALPPREELPPEVVAVMDAYDDVLARWATANDALNSHTAVLDAADLDEAAEVRLAIRRGIDPRTLTLTTRSDAEQAHRLDVHTEKALHGLGQDTTKQLIDTCLAHRDEQIDRIQPGIDTAKAELTRAILAVRVARGAYLRKVAEAGWWAQLHPHNLPTYTGYPSNQEMDAIVPDHRQLDGLATLGPITGGAA